MQRVWFGLFLAVACSGGGGAGHLPAAPAVGGSSSSGGSRTSHAGSSSQSDAGAAGEGAGESLGGAGPATAGGASDGGDAIVLETAGAPPQAPPGVCAPDMKFGAEQAQDAGAAAPIALVAVTPDELSVAFTTGSADTLELHLADRTSTKAAFSQATLTMPQDYEAASGVSLSSDGLRLILVLKDHSGFGELSRASRSDAFEGDPDTTAYAKINSLKPMSGNSVGWPVLSSDGKDLYFLSYFGQALAVQSKLDKGGVFDFGTEIDPFTLGGNDHEYKLLSGLSSDQRAIFFFDQATKHSMALFRSRDGAPFYDPLDLGARQGVAPSQDCSHLYSSVASGLVVQTAK